MSALTEKLRKARTLRIETGGYVFFVLRPTPLEREEIRQRGSVAEGIFSLIVGWEGVTELAMLGGGSPHPLPFDPSACAEWLSDRPDLFNPIVSAVVSGYENYLLLRETELKNSLPG